jgi:hypothetical protein
MAKTYMTGWGMRGERTARGGRDGVHCAAQSYDGSVIVSNRYVEDDNGNEHLEIRVGTNDDSSCYSDWNSPDFIGTLEEFKALLQLRKDIREGKVSVVRHRDPSGVKKSIKQMRVLGFSDDEIEKKLKIRINDYLKK